MKKFMLFALCLVLVAPLFAADITITKGLRYAEPTLLPDGNMTFAEMMESSALRGRPFRATPNVVLEGAEPGFVLPIVGSAPGANNTFFRSETVIVNRLNRPQNIAIFYFPTAGGAANCTRASQTMSLPAQSWALWSDFVADYLGTSGLGAVIAIGVTSSGQVDSSARIDGNSRIWTPVPGTTNGTSSQNFPSVSLGMPAGGQSSFGLRHDEFYRTNWGVFNYGLTRRTFNGLVNGLRGRSTFSESIDACSLVLKVVPAGTYGGFELYIEAQDGGALYFTFGSSVDNVTGDSWSVIGRSN